MIRSGSAKTARPTSRSSIWRRCAPSPTITVFRPADATEAAECWQLALESTKTPSTLALTRQNLPAVRTEFVEENLCAYGAYELADGGRRGRGDDLRHRLGSRDRARGAHAASKAHGHPTRVVSVPCFELFEKQSADYQAAIIGNAPVKVAIEAGIRLGWDRFIGTRRHLHRHDRLRRQRHDRAALSAFRHHRRGGGEGCRGAAAQSKRSPAPQPAQAACAN